MTLTEITLAAPPQIEVLIVDQQRTVLMRWRRSGYG